MNVLLLLSALLSALVGGGAAVRQPQLVEAVATRACDVAQTEASTAVTARPAPRQADARGVAAPVIRLAVVAAEPLFAGRRRE